MKLLDCFNCFSVAVAWKNDSETPLRAIVAIDKKAIINKIQLGIL
jgi:hypothetical protein